MEFTRAGNYVKWSIQEYSEGSIDAMCVCVYTIVSMASVGESLTIIIIITIAVNGVSTSTFP